MAMALKLKAEYDFEPISLALLCSSPSIFSNFDLAVAAKDMKHWYEEEILAMVSAASRVKTSQENIGADSSCYVAECMRSIVENSNMRLLWPVMLAFQHYLGESSPVRGQDMFVHTLHPADLDVTRTLEVDSAGSILDASRKFNILGHRFLQSHGMRSSNANFPDFLPEVTVSRLESIMALRMHPLFGNLLDKDCVVAGGSLVRALYTGAAIASINATPCISPYDIDIFCTQDKARAIVARAVALGWKTVGIWDTRTGADELKYIKSVGITLSKENWRCVDVVCPCTDIWDYISNFDLGICQIAFDGTKINCSPRHIARWYSCFDVYVAACDRTEQYMGVENNRVCKYDQLGPIVALARRPVADEAEIQKHNMNAAVFLGYLELVRMTKRPKDDELPATSGARAKRVKLTIIEDEGEDEE
jgi:hypothetical protein